MSLYPSIGYVSTNAFHCAGVSGTTDNLAILTNGESTNNRFFLIYLAAPLCSAPSLP